MQIKVVAFGNYDEAFVEDRITDGVNIIYSNDNNKGKTLVIQGMLFALGNTPIFPTGFDQRRYYFYTKIEAGTNEYEFLRRNESVIVKSGDKWQEFDSLSELKYYINKHLFTLPTIKKQGEDKIVDLVLFYQLFFIGQDKRNTSNIQNTGYYNKSDFMNMLKALDGCQEALTTDMDVEQVRKKIVEKKTKVNVLNRKMKLVKENPEVASYAIKYSDREELNRKRKALDEIHGRISNYKKKRTRENNRKIKLEHLLSELNSLNQTIKQGKMVCAQCGADTIIYSNGDLSFEVSNKHVRKKVVNSVREQIALKGEIVEELTGRINIEQDQLSRELSELSPEVQDILIFSQEIATDEQYSSDLLQVNAEIEALKAELARIGDEDSEAKKRYKKMMEIILSEMNRLYRAVDPDGILIFSGLFSKHGENYSGSEEQEFYFCKLLALNSYFEHQFPIIVDSFRSGELSSQKEQTMIGFYKGLRKQVILTSTLKTEEYEELKYDSIDDMNAIDYSGNQNSQILQNSYAERFKSILDEFGICTNEDLTD